MSYTNRRRTEPFVVLLNETTAIKYRHNSSMSNCHQQNVSRCGDFYAVGANLKNSRQQSVTCRRSFEKNVPSRQLEAVKICYYLFAKILCFQEANILWSKSKDVKAIFNGYIMFYRKHFSSLLASVDKKNSAYLR